MLYRRRLQCLASLRGEGVRCDEDCGPSCGVEEWRGDSGPSGRVDYSFRKGPVDNGFRREHNLALISLGFQKVPNPDPDLLAHALRDYDLVFILDGDDGHR